MVKFLCALARNNRGATAIEYGLILALIAIACVGAFGALGSGISTKWNYVATVVLAH